MAELAIRLVFSLAVVVGLLLVVVKIGGRRFRGRTGAAVRVVHRQPLSRTSSVAVVEVGSRILVLGTTEHQISVLAELEEGELATGPADAEVIELDTLAATRTDLRAVAAGSDAPTPQLAPQAALQPAPAPAKRAVAGKRRRETPTRTRATQDGPLVGSLLSPQTWRQALTAASGRAS